MTLSVTEVNAGFGDATVLRTVSLAVEPGEVVTVVGPSGTGKTTLLRLLATFRRPDAGTVAWDGRDIWAMADDERLGVRRQVSMVFQEPSLFNAPVHRNVSYGLRVREPWQARLHRGLRELFGSSRPADTVLSALETVGLADAVDQNALSLSGGEAQRVAFARALAVDPAVMLLDEPTSNLDPHNTALLENAIERARDRGVGVVVATHDMHQAKRISDRIAFLHDGELVETGPPEQLFENPTDARTARFLDGELLVGDRGGSRAPQSPTADP
ncbi:phosphate ABC transporter ATP-binding protein [Haloarcula sp. CBA1130]|uniref:ABC transporter ATP-binding protein n=1 Tax=unclassified Haloarcula TaxID=2624677 RepID=UPI001244105F|nr:MULTISPECIES: phosphate ABC transporter ATP-binding protein [unclassified Haloarcula]KAA9398977.1 phosphate ABC transporter ATP-binding protein [Haloarcula sp. CBA1129]KAA9403492.1 phosphate ABC transporter ATP-binding protein [Haloarcula sp. CBA1130]